MKVYSTNDKQMIATNVKEQATNAMITSRQNGQVMLLNTSPIQTSISPQMNQSILISTTPQMANMSSSGKGDILLSNVHLVSALQSPMIWSGDGMIKKATVTSDKTAIDSERIIRTNPPTIVANDLTAQSTTPTFLTIMTPQTNTVYNSQPQQLIMVGELAPNQIILTSDESTEILQQCKQMNTAETGRIKVEPVSSKALASNGGCGQVKQSQPLANAAPATELNITELRVEVIDGRGTSKKRSRKVNGLTQTTTDVLTQSSAHRQATITSSKLPPTNLQNQVGSQPRNNQSSVATNEIGYSAQLLSQLNDTGALPAISCSQVSSVLSALEPTGSSALVNKQTQTQESLQAQALASKLQFGPSKSTCTKQTRETNTKSVDSEKLKYYLRAQYSVLKQEDLANNLPGIYQCSECNYLSTNSSTVESHFERYHHLKSTVSTLPKKNILKCVGCSNEFYSKHSLQVHLLQDHEASGSEVSVMTDIIVQSQTPKGNTNDVPKEPRKEDGTNSQIADNQIQQMNTNTANSSSANYKTQNSNTVASTNSAEQMAENTVPKPAAPKATCLASYSSIASSLVIDLRASETAEDSDTRKSDEQLPTMDCTQLTNAQCLVDLTAQFSAAAQKLTLQEKHNSDAFTKDEEAAEDIVNKNNVNEDEEKPANDDKPSDVEMKEPALPARKKRGRPRSSRIASSAKKSMTHDGIDSEYSQRRCDIDGCELRYEFGSNLVYHQQCHKKGTFECPECCSVMPRWSAMAMHLWKTHNIDMELISCERCSYKTYFSKFLNMHVLTHGDERPFLCDTCGKGFKTRKQMRNHKVIHKSNSEQENAEGDASKTSKFSCTVCGRQMKDSRNLRLHMDNVHHKMRRFSCSFCSYTTYSRGSLLIHQRTHTGEKPFKCDACDYASKDHNSLRRHKMQHSGNKAYNCPHCSYACIQSSTYKAHLKSKHPGLDTGLMFSCAVCPFRTVNKANLLSHSASHVASPANRSPVQSGTAATGSGVSAVAAPHEEPTPVSLEVAEIDSALRPSPLPILGLPHAEIIISDHLGFEDSSESCEMIIPESQVNRR
ncbi:hypothetical protein LSTR_LSTR002238 [Laodelphax striatellus]|uniref:C2H2-type domain-containing protein n=1 Tax=Laodelphax striatellus TaxID=195883 RepID=A0A482XEL3_LAOST|nr:hypothetical protein LSTR_LSTR002238 [Laodelphax striatellus]